SHLGLSYLVRRSTFAEANQRRCSQVFGDIYMDVYRRHGSALADSRLSDADLKRLYIMDSTTISLFKDILKGVGRNPKEGKKKGGIKAHTIIKASEHVPCLIRYSEAARHDHMFLEEVLSLSPGSISTFDKGIALIYKKRWQIELLFKQLKQNFPLKYFLGDNENAIEIQIWTAMLANLLITLVRSRLKRKWAFSNMVSIIRQQLMNYIDIYCFLEDPEGSWREIVKENKIKYQNSLFPELEGAYF
ncbi:MAG: transposase, partial [Bacteroidota bacterium]|nr:transposase [Bacteroidota bacterium]